MSHLAEWIIDRIAEDDLRGPERAEAEAHLRVCPDCSHAVEQTREFFESLSVLSAFDPSPGFADAVMARVQVRPAESRVWGWARRLIPQSRRGWIGLSLIAAVPTAALAAIAVAIALIPALTPGSIVRWTGAWLHETAGPFVANLAGNGIPAAVRVGVDALLGLGSVVPLGIVGLLVLASLIATPLSAWSLSRLLRPVSMDEHHAH